MTHKGTNIMSSFNQKIRPTLKRGQLEMGFRVKKLKYVAQCKKAFAFVLSHFGLSIMLTAYLVAGASIFELLEKDNEVKACFDDFNDYQQMETMTLKSLIEIIYSLHPDNEINTKRIVGIMETFSGNVMDIDYDGRDCARYGQPGGPQHKWSWHGSLLFVVTVVSTIGYGHIAPNTQWGRILCIGYAIIGIPLTMVCLATIGSTLSNGIRITYNQIIKCECFKRKKKHNMQKQRHSQRNDVMPEEMSQTVITSCVQIVYPNDNTHFRYQTGTQGVADNKTNNDTNQTSLNTRILVPVSKLDVACHADGKASNYPNDCKIMSQENMQMRHSTLHVDQCMLTDDNKGNEAEIEHGVPFLVTIFIIISYIFFGAFLFGVWEDWDMLQATYFCFISISTIGFGDLVPGTDVTLPYAHTELLFGSVYIILGLALISTGFALMQEEVMEKMTWIGRKLKLI